MELKKIFSRHQPNLGALEILKFIGPGLLVTVGFIDPGNWAANVAAGSSYGYSLLWMVTLSTIMLIFLQHNAAHLGIVTGLCLAEASSTYLPKWLSRAFLASAVLAAISTALAEVLGAAIGLNMLFKIPFPIGAFMTVATVMFVLFSNSYRRIEKYIIGFVSLIGLAFLYELSLVHLHWSEAFQGWVTPTIPRGALPIVMSVLGAVVMPHNIFLHSEIIQSRKWSHEGEAIIKKQLRYEFLDTMIAMAVGWAINSAMIIMAAAVFFHEGIKVSELSQAEATLRPLLGNASAIVFAIALLLAGFSSSVTAAMAGGSIFSGISSEPFDLKDPHSRLGVFITLIGAIILVFFLRDPFKGLIWSQIALSIQLPWTIFALIYLTSSAKVMGQYKNSLFNKIMLWIIAGIVAALNVMLLIYITM